MELLRLTTPKDVKRYISHPEIFEAIAEDGVVFDEYTPTVGEDDHFIVTGTEAMFYLHPFSAGVYQIHAHVHPDYRDGAKDAAHRALCYAFRELSALKVVCLIPEIFPRVRGFAQKCGLTDEGFIAESYLKYNSLNGMHLLGISKRKFEGH